MDSGPSLWLILLTIGVIVLGAAAVYGIMRNRTRTVSEKLHTEAATRAEYKSEDGTR
jgi:Sec-independent protein translocase protein TatA